MREVPSFENREMLQEQAESLMQQRLEEKLEKPPLYASFGLLVDAKGEGILAERQTEPQKGLYSVVGGKIDQSPSGEEIKSLTSTSRRLTEDGLESPTNTMIRELVEEVYKNLADKPVDDLIKIFKPERKMIVYDYNNNTYCFLYTVQKPEGIKIQVSKREIGKVSGINQIESKEINPMTRFFLRQISLQSELPPNLRFGPIGHIALPRDYLKRRVRVEQGDKASHISLSKELHEPGYLIQY